MAGEPGGGVVTDTWPPLMPTALATRYCGFKGQSALRKAYHDGKIRPAGRRGGTGTLMWRREDLDSLRLHGIVAYHEWEAPEIVAPSTSGTYLAVFSVWCKIGKSLDIARRLQDFNLPGPMRLVGHLPSMDAERELHERFRALRTNGEWFRFEGELVEYVRKLQEGAP